MLRAVTLFHRARSDDPFARAYLTSAVILRTLDRLDLTTDGRGLVFKRAALYDRRFLACEIETTDLAESLAKDLRKYRQVVALTHVLGLPVKALVRPNSVTFAIDLGPPTPVSWRARARLFLQNQSRVNHD